MGLLVGQSMHVKCCCKLSFKNCKLDIQHIQASLSALMLVLLVMAVLALLALVLLLGPLLCHVSPAAAPQLGLLLTLPLYCTHAWRWPKHMCTPCLAHVSAPCCILLLCVEARLQTACELSTTDLLIFPFTATAAGAVLCGRWGRWLMIPMMGWKWSWDRPVRRLWRLTHTSCC